MSARDALLAAVLADPYSDAPRLVFADWYEENGDPARAELIRLQIELARRPGVDPHWPPWYEAGDREQRLLGEHQERWLQEAVDAALNGMARTVAVAVSALTADRRSDKVKAFLSKVERHLKAIEVEQHLSNLMEEQQIIDMISEGCPNTQGY
jgi:uncharacterized protein (TIGR02996 family)